MEKWVCTVCGYVYDPAENDGVKFEDLPEDYVVHYVVLVKTNSKKKHNF